MTDKAKQFESYSIAYEAMDLQAPNEKDYVLYGEYSEYTASGVSLIQIPIYASQLLEDTAQIYEHITGHTYDRAN